MAALGYAFVAAEALQTLHHRDLEERDQEPVRADEEAVDEGGIARGDRHRQRHHADVGEEDQREHEGHRDHLQVDPVEKGIGRRAERGRRRLGLLRARLRDVDVDDDAVEERGQAIPEEEPAPVPVGEQPPHGHPEGEAEVDRHAEGGEAGGPLVRGQEVGDDRGCGGAVEVGHEAEQDEQGHEDPGRGSEAHGHREDAAAEEADHERPPAAQAVGQEAAGQDRHDGAGPVGEQQLRRLGLREPELAQQDDGEEGDDERPHLVDEGARDQQAHGRGQAGEEAERVLEHGRKGAVYRRLDLHPGARL